MHRKSDTRGRWQKYASKTQRTICTSRKCRSVVIQYEKFIPRSQRLENVNYFSEIFEYRIFFICQFVTFPTSETARLFGFPFCFWHALSLVLWVRRARQDVASVVVAYLIGLLDLLRWSGSLGLHLGTRDRFWFPRRHNMITIMRWGRLSSEGSIDNSH